MSMSGITSSVSQPDVGLMPAELLPLLLMVPLIVATDVATDSDGAIDSDADGLTQGHRQGSRGPGAY